MKNKLLLLIAGLFTVFIFVGVDQYNSHNKVVESVNNYTEYKDHNYLLRDNLSTILFFGVDKDAEYLKEYQNTFDVRNEVQADFIVILVFDNDNKDVKVIKINRDTMFETAEIVDHDKDDFIQLALAHTYGSGGSDSAVNLMSAVSSIFDDYIPINDYIKIPYDVVKVITDAVGGVEIEVSQNMESIDSRLVKGSRVNLDGDLALKYVKSRMGLDDDRNKTRMNRQAQYIVEFLKKYNSIEGISLEKVTNIADMVYSNLSFTHIENIINEANMDNVKFYDIDGYNSLGPEFMEFNADKESAIDIAFEVFYERID